MNYNKEHFPVNGDENRKKRNVIDAAITYLSFSDRTVAEMRGYLKKKEYSVDEIEEAIAYLKDMNYVDDKNYAQRYIEQATSRGKGSLKVKNDLKKRGIDDSVIEELQFEEEVFDKEAERQRAWEMAEIFYEEVKDSFKPDPDDDFETKREKYKEKQRAQGKLGRRLVSKGYPQDVVYSILSELFS